MAFLDPEQRRTARLLIRGLAGWEGGNRIAVLNDKLKLLFVS